MRIFVTGATGAVGSELVPTLVGRRRRLAVVHPCRGCRICHHCCNRARSARPSAWIGRLLAGEHMVVMMTQVSGSANERAKRELDWRPAHPNWREGLSQVLRLSAARSAA